MKTIKPKDHPLGDGHHTEVPFTEEDEKIGNVLSFFLGTLFSDVDEEYFYHKRTSLDEWKRIARALRIHGLCIINKE